MNKDNLVILLNKIRENNLKLNIEKLLNLDAELTELLVNINDNTIFTNAYGIIDKKIDEKFVIRQMIRVKDSQISNIIHNLCFNVKDYKYAVSFISESENKDMAYAYSLLLKNENLTKLFKYKEIMEYLKSVNDASKLMFINSIISSNYLINNPNEIMNFIEKIKRCKDESTAFIVYKMLINDRIKESKYFKYCTDKLILSKNKKMSEALYLVMTDNDILRKNDYTIIIDRLFYLLSNDEYCKITNLKKVIETFMENGNLAELKGDLENISSSISLKENTLVLVMK